MRSVAWQSRTSSWESAGWSSSTSARAPIAASTSVCSFSRSTTGSTLNHFDSWFFSVLLSQSTRSSERNWMHSRDTDESSSSSDVWRATSSTSVAHCSKVNNARPHPGVQSETSTHASSTRTKASSFCDSMLARRNVVLDSILWTNRSNVNAAACDDSWCRMTLASVKLTSSKLMYDDEEPTLLRWVYFSISSTMRLLSKFLNSLRSQSLFSLSVTSKWASNDRAGLTNELDCIRRRMSLKGIWEMVALPLLPHLFWVCFIMA
ncbi:hypothetical protein, conserved [Angomonas deanei]|uniref:Uncharacterized protein n=1 Tax=Angomonas deanei TaxID=59799 RepID=A0A7G2CWM1_9TRYP|nr:hypothetical protein, conserved [Angomonas deanei]